MEVSDTDTLRAQIIGILESNTGNSQVNVQVENSPLGAQVKIYGDGVKSIEGLQALSGRIYSLSIENTSISDFTPIGKLGIKYLSLLNCTLDELPVVLNEQLTALSISQIPVSDLSAIGSLPNLSYLSIANCPISSFTPLHQSKIQELCISGHYTDFSFIRELPELEGLKILYTNLNGELDVSMLPLRYMIIAGNLNIERIRVSCGNINIRIVEMPGNLEIIVAKE